MGRRAVAIVALLVGSTGCRQLLGFENPTSTSDGQEGPHDGPAPGDVGMELMPVDGCTSFSTVLDTCATTALGPLQISATATYNTSTHLLDVGGATSVPQHVVFATPTGEIDAIFATSIEIGASLRITGTRSVALIATGTITIQGGGMVDVSAGGAGARTACVAEQGRNGNNDISGGSGGGGGGFQGAGGNGGNGDSDQGQSIGGPGGESRPRPTAPLGGCGGGKGGDGGAGDGSLGGAGGGAVLFAAGSSITITGVVFAGGGGGLGGEGGSGGGGGGGAGGMIVIETPTLSISGAVTANGGGGGEGGGLAISGQNGSPGNRLAGTPAPGGSGGATTGADGGQGSGGGSTFGSSPGSVLQDGGGGGGGGAGFIAIGTTSPTISGIVSPAHGEWP